ncbi:MAG: hypothetical protein ACREJC_15715 [Tepidisphaeraceae bacterium]
MAFKGRTWLVVRVPWKTRAVLSLRKQDWAYVDTDNGIILFRSFNDDMAVIALLHEISHIAYPEVGERHIEHGDSTFKDALEAFGVDLSPLLEAYE